MPGWDSYPVCLCVHERVCVYINVCVYMTVCVCLFVINYRITQSIRRTAANVSVVTSSLCAYRSCLWSA